MDQHRIQNLRLQYGKITDMPVRSRAHVQTGNMLQRMPAEDLQQIIKAKIRWLSPVAKNIAKGKPMGPLPNMHQIVNDNGRGWG